MKKIAVAGTGYVGLSMAVLLAQHHQVTAVDIIAEKVDLINAKKSPIQDKEIEEFLATKELHLFATLDADMAYRDAEYVIIADQLTMIVKEISSTQVLLKQLLNRCWRSIPMLSWSLNQPFL